MQAESDLKEARILTQAVQVASFTHDALSHGVHDTVVPALVDHLAAADLAGPTAACSLAQSRWIAQHHNPERVVTHESLAVDGLRLVKGGTAFSAKSPSGKVALMPTVVHSGGAKGPAIEECFVIDEQARVLKRMYLQAAAARSARAKRRAAVQAYAPACMMETPHVALCMVGGFGSRTGTGTRTIWSGPEVFSRYRCSRSSYRLQRRGGGACTAQQPSALPAGYFKAREEVTRKVRYRAAALCFAVPKARAAALR
jgi:hypothetical protein